MLDGKSVVVTGSSRGIGKAIALDLAENGADVVVALPMAIERGLQSAIRDPRPERPG